MARSFFDNILDSATFGLYSGGKKAYDGGSFWSGWKSGLKNGFANPEGFSSSFTDFVGLTNVGEQEDAYNEARGTYDELLKGNEETFKDVTDKITGTRDEISELLGGEEAVQNYIDAVNGFNGENYKTDLSKLENYEYGKTVDQFLDPAAQYQIDNSVKATQNAMAGQGGLSGGAAALQLQAVASEKANELYDKAFERMTEDKNFDYSTVKDLIDAESKNNQTALAADTTKMNNLSKPFESYIGNLSGSTEDEINALLAEFANESSLKQGKSQLAVDNASQGTWLSQLLGNDGIMSGAGSLIKALIA